MNKYRPETTAEKKERLVREAEAKEEGNPVTEKRNESFVRYGLNNVTRLIE